MGFDDREAPMSNGWDDGFQDSMNIDGMTDIGMQGFNNTMDQFDTAMQSLNNITN